MNHYEILGVDRTGTVDDIKKAYRKLASQHHPDKGGDTKKFQEIQKAYDTLGDGHKRAAYDQELAGGGRRQFHFNTNPMGDQHGGDFNSIFDHLHRQFGFGFRGGEDPFAPFQQANQNRQPRNRDVRISITLDLIETLTEQTKTLKLSLPGNKQENIEIKIPRGVSNGTTIRYPNLGDYSIPNVVRADLYVQFMINPSFKFEQHGIDLITHHTINCLDAIVGCDKEITGIDDKTFKVVVPPGTQHGARFAIPDQGLYTTDHPGRGRLIVIFDVYVPNELTDEQLRTIKEIQVTL